MPSRKTAIGVETIRRVRLAMPGVEVSTTYGSPALEIHRVRVLIERQAALAPEPRVNLILYHGCWRRARRGGEQWCRRITSATCSTTWPAVRDVP